MEGPGITRDEYLLRVRELIPLLRERASLTEELRRLPDETVKDLKESELLRALQPRRWGGLGASALDFFDAVLEVGTVCGSTAWVMSVLGVHSWQLGLFPEAAQQDVWGEDTSTLISSSYAPTGHVEAADGGFRLRGRWSFSSGCDHCQWVFVGGLVPGDDGVPDMRTFLVPRADYEIDDNWHVAGLSGTGSKEIVIDGAFVPEHRTHRAADAFAFTSPGLASNPDPVLRLPFPPVFGWAIAVPAIGVARGALALYTEQTRSRRSAYDGSEVSGGVGVQLRLAQAASEIDAATARLRESLQQMSRAAASGGGVPIPLRARARFDAADAVARSVRATDLLFEASGGRALFLDNPLQRAFRDVHAMRAHAINDPEAAAQIFARSELGGDPGPMV
jgi:3-hydroxy-9,10-secoandrosta-1,3,5(10)-triene-9,17-dione monooxygenase